MSVIKFIKNFYYEPHTIGAVCPSSSALSKKIITDIGLEKASSVVELGPGTGVFTKKILNTVNKNCNFFAIELNEDFYAILRKKYPKLKIYNGSAVSLKEFTKIEKIKEVDVIVSGLPWASFSPQLQIQILNSVLDVLKPGGIFTTFAYVQGTFLPKGIRFSHLIKKKFSHVYKTSIVWRNIPPAFAYRCIK